jgi:site-specific DNA recombinase
VVIGEPHRAFCGNRFSLTFPVFVHYVIALWVPEVEGPVDPGSEAHDLVMSIFGGMSRGERMPIQHRVRSAMAAQAAGQGRFPGGRPRYRYRMADAGPHPTRARPPTGSGSAASNGTLPRRPFVQRIFAEFIAGTGLHLIARGLYPHRRTVPPTGRVDRPLAHRWP